MLHILNPVDLWSSTDPNLQLHQFDLLDILNTTTNEKLITKFIIWL